MVEHESSGESRYDFQLPYRPGEFADVATRLTRLVAALEAQHITGLVPEELRFAAAALARAELLLSSAAAGDPIPERPRSTPEPVVRHPEPEPAAPTAEQPQSLEVGQRGEWRGRVGHQPDFQRVKGGRLRAVFFLAQHNDPADPEKTVWIRCYNLDRYAEALRKKGRLAGAEVLVRGAFQGERTVTFKNRSPEQQQTVYCYGLRILEPARDQAPR